MHGTFCRTIIPGLCLVATVVVAPTGALAEETWITRAGVTTIHLNAALLEDLGVEITDVVCAVPAPPGVDQRMEDPHFSFALAQTSDLAFKVDRAVAVPYGLEGGAIRHSGGITLTIGSAVEALTDFAIAYVPATVDGPGGTHPTDDLVLRSGADPSVAVCDARDTMFDFDRAGGTLSLHYMNLSFTETWAERIGRSDLAGWNIGYIEAQIAVEPLSGTPDEGSAYVPNFLGFLDVGLGGIRSIGQVAHQGTYPNGAVALSMATTACNLGDTDVPWLAPMQEDHPTIAMAIYRLLDGRIEQIGVSWMKHGFYALSNSDCTPCQHHSDGDFLGVGCSDTYGFNNNSDRDYLGPRREVNPFKGSWSCTGSHFAGGQPDCVRRHDETGHGPLDHRLVAGDQDLATPGATYVYEAYYVVSDDGDKTNNIGSRRCTMSWNGSAWSFSTPQDGNPLILGPAIDRMAADLRTEVPVGDLDGNVILSVKTQDLGGGLRHYEYALFNFDSDRCIRSFEIPIAAGVSLTSIEFHDSDLDPTNDWRVAVEDGSIRWETDTFAQNPDANALTFGYLFNFRFDADAPPADQQASLGVFKPFGPDFVMAATLAPDNPASAGDARSIGAAFDLAPPHPNPATGFVQAPFTIGRGGRVRVDVVDPSGRIVAHLADETLAAGTHSVVWNAEGFPAGVYFARLETQEGSMQRSVTLLSRASR